MIQPDVKRSHRMSDCMDPVLDNSERGNTRDLRLFWAPAFFFFFLFPFFLANVISIYLNKDKTKYLPHCFMALSTRGVDAPFFTLPRLPLQGARKKKKHREKSKGKNTAPPSFSCLECLCRFVGPSPAVTLTHYHKYLVSAPHRMPMLQPPGSSTWRTQPRRLLVDFCSQRRTARATHSSFA
jgi:hypothetical protein